MSAGGRGCVGCPCTGQLAERMSVAHGLTDTLAGGWIERRVR